MLSCFKLHAQFSDGSKYYNDILSIYVKVYIIVLCSYNSTMGVFTVPPDRSELYLFPAYLLVDAGQFAEFNIVVNDVIVCTTYGDENSNNGTDYPQATCNAVMDVAEVRALFIFTDHKVCFQKYRSFCSHRGRETSLAIETPLWT